MKSHHQILAGWSLINEPDQVTVLLRMGNQVLTSHHLDSPVNEFHPGPEKGYCYFLWAIGPEGQEIWSPKKSEDFFRTYEGLRRNLNIDGGIPKGIFQIQEEVMSYARSLSEHRRERAA